MTHKIAVFMCLMFLWVPAYANDAGTKDAETIGDLLGDEVAVPKEVPKSGIGALAKGAEVLDLAKAGKYFSMAAGGIWILMFIIKLGRKHLKFMQGMSRRWLYILVAVLTFLAMLFTKLQTNLSWNAALLVLTSGPFVAFLNDLIKRGVFGKLPSGD